MPLSIYFKSAPMYYSTDLSLSLPKPNPNPEN